ncbi:MAG: acyl carrier protein [Legionella sp.]|nr:acyl carrier protein [Legionella sp.]
MIYDGVWQALKSSILEVLPVKSEHTLQPEESLRQLGANSIDRAEIIMLTMARLELKIPLIEFSQAKNIASLIDIFLTHAKA